MVKYLCRSQILIDLSIVLVRWQICFCTQVRKHVITRMDTLVSPIGQLRGESGCATRKTQRFTNEFIELKSCGQFRQLSVQRS